jgi:magnesium-protoporphyrin IX monomethyl ester (oxidative) cyclase
MDVLYNWHIRRFYDSKGYRRRFAKRIWEHRWSLWHLVRHLPQVAQAVRYFHANKAELERMKTNFTIHPRQPLGLHASLSAELQADAIAAISPAEIKVSRRVKPASPDLVCASEI